VGKDEEGVPFLELVGATLLRSPESTG